MDKARLVKGTLEQLVEEVLDQQLDAQLEMKKLANQDLSEDERLAVEKASRAMWESRRELKRAFGME